MKIRIQKTPQESLVLNPLSSPPTFGELFEVSQELYSRYEANKRESLGIQRELEFILSSK